MGDGTTYPPNYSSADLTPSDMTAPAINHSTQKYPFCIVWTPIPFLTWIFPMIGHMGIAMSSGVIRDFAGHYLVQTDKMAFGKPTKYLQMDPMLAVGGVEGWDRAVIEASEIYKNRMHNLFCDNCHSHVATALIKMKYNNTTSWNMVKLAFLMFFNGKYVGVLGFFLSWGPFFVSATATLLLCIWLL